MAFGDAKKRKLASGATGLQTKKQKTGKQTPKIKSKKSNPKRPAAVDSLQWRSAKLPDMFDDAGGFYGLEEVDDVEIVRNGNVVEFRAAETSAAPAEGDSADMSQSGGKEDDSDEFEGFEDEPSTAQPEAEQAPATAASTNPPESDATKQKQPKKKNKQKDQTVSKADSQLQTNAFAGLDTIDDTQDDVDLSEWVKLDLSPQILSCLAKLKFLQPTLIQAAAIPPILSGHDVIGKASTGSGKTLAFGIPIVERWLERLDEAESKSSKPTHSPTALILSPTRELAHQLTDHIKNLCASLPHAPFVCSVTGGLAVQKQQRQLAKADIVVGTPGRLWEVLSASSELMASFRNIGFLVVDEADRLLSEGHFKEASEILSALDRKETDEDGDEEGENEDSAASTRQTLVFSATFHKGLQQKLAGKGKYGLMNKEDSMEYLLQKLNFREEKPRFVDVNPVSQMAEGLKEGLVECGAMEKDLYLYALLLLYPNVRTLVFTNSISSARRLTPMLQNMNLPTNPLHAQMPQKARLRSIERFTGTGKGKASILIATDVAARGLDIPGVDLVVHYHVPRAADTYVHRSGRTARAERTGLSILLCAPEEVVPTRRLISKVHTENGGGSKSNSFFVQTLDMDRKLVNRLKPRVTLAKKIADAGLAKEKGSKEDDWMRKAADDLGVEYDSDEMQQVGNWGGRGRGRKEKQSESRALTKAELGAMRAELRELLSKRVNAGVSEKYIATGLVDMDELLRGAKGDFLGKVAGLEIDTL